MLTAQSLIRSSLHTDEILISQRRGYRTHSVTGKQLAKKVKNIRVFFKKKNIKKQDRVILLGANSINWVAVYFASILCGVTVVPLDLFTNRTLLKKIQKQVKAKAIFQDKWDLKKSYSLNNLDKMLDNISGKPNKYLSNPKDILEIVYTSGTTGDPKGVILTNENLASAIGAAAESVPIKIRLRMLNLLPLSHVFGHIHGLFLLLYQGHHIFFLDSLRPRKTINFIRNKSIHSVVIVPGLLSSLKNYLKGKSVVANLGFQFRLIGVGGAALDTKLERWWKRHLILVVKGYALTETAGVVSTNSLLFSKTGSVGKISPMVELKLEGQKEILVKGKNVTPGYYKNKEKTQASLDHGWFRTGDVGEIKNNRLYITARKKDLIVTSSGLNVYPADLEMVLNRMHGVEESCVVQKDDKIHAVLMLRNKAKPQDVIRKANNKLLSHQNIASFSLWPQKHFPKTPTGKIKKYLVIEELEKSHTSRSYDNRLYSVISDTLKPQQKIRSNARLSDLGMDSLKGIELMAALEQEFDVEINESQLTRSTRVVDLEGLMSKKIKKVKFKKWPLHPIARFVRFIGQYLIGFPIIWTFTRPQYHGLENLPSTPVIYVGNHQSAWDVPLAMRKIKARTVIAAASEYIFGIGTKGILIKAYRTLTGYLSALFFNTFAFGESMGTDASFEFAGELLDRGYSIIILPEGHRTPDGTIKKFQPGVGYLGLEMGVPLVPFRVEGLFEVLPIHKILPKFGPSTVTFGKPIPFEDFKDLSYLRITDLVEKKVREL